MYPLPVASLSLTPQHPLSSSCSFCLCLLLPLPSVMIDLQGQATSDFLRFNKLNAQNKVRFGRSPIHAWGIFATQPFQEGEAVIEYVGEYIRNAVADHREKM